MSSSPQGVVADLTEDRLLAQVLPLLAGSRTERVGPGDDAAVLDVASPLIATTDTMVLGRDWRDDWSNAEQVAAKAVVQNLADIAAMGAVPTTLLLTLVLDPQTPLAWVLDFARALGEQCRRYAVSVAGGDLSSAPAGVKMVTITALGELAGAEPVLRSGAQPGDVLAISGPLGRSAVGLALLERAASGTALDAREEAALAHHRSPSAPLSQGPIAARAGASAMLDVSDGLSRDAARIARASGCLIEIDSATLAPDLNWAEGLVPRDQARACVLNGGEEHSLLATFPDRASVPEYWRILGRVEAPAAGEDPGVHLDGRPLTEAGWDHFHPAR
ncbi:thiamine-phosphate kinase [Nostocoides australiense]|nr:thiamine-phosphate kinase [Actinomycetota bacterium]HPF79689.1 thiamine-phosphate kinase [Tetrasphaera australiensis]HRW00231.1 thiamine-phosphate kinase [Tetrasphaera sp.]